jgi:hypothetical protein
MTVDPEPNFLLHDGPFTDAGLAHLAGLDGLFDILLTRVFRVDGETSTSSPATWRSWAICGSTTAAGKTGSWSRQIGCKRLLGRNRIQHPARASNTGTASGSTRTGVRRSSKHITVPKRTTLPNTADFQERGPETENFNDPDSARSRDMHPHRGSMLRRSSPTGKRYAGLMKALIAYGWSDEGGWTNLI